MCTHMESILCVVTGIQSILCIRVLLTGSQFYAYSQGVNFVHTHRESILCIPVYTHILSKSNQIETEGELKHSRDNCFDAHLFYAFFINITLCYAKAPMTSLHVFLFVNNIVIHCQEKQIESKRL